MPQPLSLLAVRFAPDLDEYNRAPASSAFTLPMSVERNGTNPTVRELALQVSYDDGATWQPAQLTATDGHWTAQLQHPAGAAFVSLRATATDSDGNSVDQTIIRAYALT